MQDHLLPVNVVAKTIVADTDPPNTKINPLKFLSLKRVLSQAFDGLVDSFGHGPGELRLKRFQIFQEGFCWYDLVSIRWHTL